MVIATGGEPRGPYHIHGHGLHAFSISWIWVSRESITDLREILIKSPHLSRSEIARQIVGDFLPASFEHLVRAAGAMRCHDDIRQFMEWKRRHRHFDVDAVGIIVPDVDRCTTDTLVAQRGI